jgi:hypothetical protein
MVARTYNRSPQNLNLAAPLGLMPPVAPGLQGQHPHTCETHIPLHTHTHTHSLYLQTSPVSCRLLLNTRSIVPSICDKRKPLHYSPLYKKPHILYLADSPSLMLPVAPGLQGQHPHWGISCGCHVPWVVPASSGGLKSAHQTHEDGVRKADLVMLSFSLVVPAVEGWSL